MNSSITKMLGLTENRNTLFGFLSVRSIDKKRAGEQREERDEMSVYRFTFLRAEWECDVCVILDTVGR